MRRRCLPLLLFCAIYLVVPPSARAVVTIDTVTVGNPGNAPDTAVMLDSTTGYGSVGYQYRIGKYEITAGQYTEFLNAVADDDPNELYSIFMDSDTFPLSFGCNIKQLGSAPNYTYTVAPDFADLPVNYVSFRDAARFTNWLHNGQPTGPQGPATTETGAYININTTATRQPGASFYIPTEDEWYKAAYHDSSAGLASVYFNFPTQSNSQPGRDPTEATNPGNNACYWDAGTYTVPAPYYKTEVGEFELSDSPYGTFDQAGSMWEWNETIITGNRGMRGGSFNDAWTNQQPTYRASKGAADDDFNLGFRLAVAVPEPSSLALATLAGILCLISNRRFSSLSS